MIKGVYIEIAICVGCEACVVLCPDIFRMNETGDRAEIIIKPEEIDDEKASCIEKAINICPADCIHWDE